MTNKQLQAMKAGRERKWKEQRTLSVERVKAYRSWLRRDVEISMLRRRGEPAKREPMPDIPSDYDYTVAREEGVR